MPGIDECLHQAMDLPGALGASVVEWVSGLALGTAGASPNGDHEATAAETAELARLTAEYAAFASPGGGFVAADTPVEDIIVTTRTGFHLLRFVETQFDTNVFVHVWLDRTHANLALARVRLQDLAERLALS
ncbi:MAG TPA: hypothetical protein VLH10_09145 [Yinghuangia sp.]|uniref:hypothetical protein n=1 Tax=Yinghuangia sp. YIM S10712 TaxID=3436930 RepID=UPI002D0ACC1F|nr:hypothetical protein [Yinghuangia sp.]